MSNGSHPTQKYWFGARAPEHAVAWFDFYRSVSKEGVLDRKTKELIAVASGALSRCEHCIRAHAKNALGAGASKEEVAEAVMVASKTASGAQLFWTSVYDEVLGGEEG